MISYFKKGVSLVEVLIGAAIIAVAFVAIMNAYGFFMTLETRTANLAKASLMAEEGLEVVRFNRDSSWNANILTKSTTTTYYLTFATSTKVWSFGTSPASEDGFMRTVNFYDVKREDGVDSGDIKPTGGTYSPNTKKITVSVSWNEKGVATSKSISTYLSNIYDN
jgi:prepilin-type N-terminal cleavage/methylation domain-containing protein